MGRGLGTDLHFFQGEDADDEGVGDNGHGVEERQRHEIAPAECVRQPILAGVRHTVHHAAVSAARPVWALHFEGRRILWTSGL